LLDSVRAARAKTTPDPPRSAHRPRARPISESTGGREGATGDSRRLPLRLDIAGTFDAAATWLLPFIICPFDRWPMRRARADVAGGGVRYEATLVYTGERCVTAGGRGALIIIILAKTYFLPRPRVSIGEGSLTMISLN